MCHLDLAMDDIEEGASVFYIWVEKRKRIFKHQIKNHGQLKGELLDQQESMT